MLVGCGAGASFAVVWFAFTSYIRHIGLIDHLLDTGTARYFRVRDLVVEEDLVHTGWVKWEEAMRRRRITRNGTAMKMNGMATKDN